MPKEFWTSEKLIKLGRLTQEKTASEIAEYFGKSKKSIKNICKQYGLTTKPDRKGGRKKAIMVSDSINELLSKKLIE